ncbi:hypothetical protein ACF0H5_013711 [Mactra antiquata]
MIWIIRIIILAINMWIIKPLLIGRIDSNEDYYRHFPSVIPSFLPVPTNLTVHEGETARLQCRIHNLGPKMAVWKKSNEPSPLTVGKIAFTPNKNIEVETVDVTETETKYDLIMKDVQQDQAGLYECQISATENYTLNVTLNVLDPVEYKPELELSGTEYVSLMEDIRLTCNATGATKAPDQVDWFFDGKIISEMNPQFYGRLYKLSDKPSPGRSLISEIIVEKATMADRGIYVCRLTKDLAKGFTVNVLNDKKNHRDPKRDNNGGNEQKQSDIMSSSRYNSGSSKLNTLQWTYFIIFFYLASLSWQR